VAKRGWKKGGAVELGRKKTNTYCKGEKSSEWMRTDDGPKSVLGEENRVKCEKREG